MNMPLYLRTLEDAFAMSGIRFLFFVQELELNHTLFLRCFDGEGKDYLIPEKELKNIRRKKDVMRYYVNHSLLNYLC